MSLSAIIKLIMANRHLSRSIVLQTLFEVDFRGSDLESAKVFMDSNTLEFAPGIVDGLFMNRLLELVHSKRQELDNVIVKAAPDWPLEKISIVDRNVLRIGLAELLFEDRKEVPSKVAINEAIELAKTFGGESSGRFVNGVLGAVYKELGEPGKEEVSGKNKKNIQTENLPVESKAGAVIFSIQDNDIFIGLVHDVFGHWTLSKGGIEEGENPEQGIVRIIKEKLSLDIDVIESIGENEYVANHPEKGRHRKKVIYFLVKSNNHEIKLNESGGIDDAKWFKLSQILDLNFYDDILPLITKAVKRIAEINK
jgi:transcription antitermination protein NusB